MPYASLAPSYAGRGCVLAAPVHRRVEDRHPTRLVGRRDTIRVDEGLRDAGIGEVAHAVVANAPGELERSLLLLGRPLVSVNPSGSSPLHLLSACLNDAEFVSTDVPFATASIVSAPVASGSGKALTPLRRMHSANFTTFARVVAAPFPALLMPPVAAALSPPLRVPPQAAPITSTTTTVTQAATGHVFRVISGRPSAGR
jgi:hypothetical protein